MARGLERLVREGESLLSEFQEAWKTIPWWRTKVQERRRAVAGVLLDGTYDLRFGGNLISSNHGCGIACRAGGALILGVNILWENTVGNLGTDPYSCANVSTHPAQWSNVMIADPLFCGPDTDDFAVDTMSPAVRGGEIIGAFPQAGCSEGVSTRSVTWGEIKARYVGHNQ
jgi:hypothetical protein